MSGAKSVLPRKSRGILIPNSWLFHVLEGRLEVQARRPDGAERAHTYLPRSRSTSGAPRPSSVSAPLRALLPPPPRTRLGAIRDSSRDSSRAFHRYPNPASPMASPDVDKDLAAKVVMQNMVRPATFNAKLRPVHLARVVPASDRAPTRRDVHRTFSRRSAFPRARQKKSLLLRRALIPAPRLPLSSCLAADQHRSRMDLPQRRVRVRCRGEPRDGPHSRLGAPPQSSRVRSHSHRPL